MRCSCLRWGGEGGRRERVAIESILDDSYERGPPVAKRDVAPHVVHGAAARGLALAVLHDGKVIAAAFCVALLLRRLQRQLPEARQDLEGDDAEAEAGRHLGRGLHLA